MSSLSPYNIGLLVFSITTFFMVHSIFRIIEHVPNHPGKSEDDMRKIRERVRLEILYCCIIGLTVGLVFQNYAEIVFNNDKPNFLMRHFIYCFMIYSSIRAFMVFAINLNRVFFITGLSSLIMGMISFLDLHHFDLSEIINVFASSPNSVNNGTDVQENSNFGGLTKEQLFCLAIGGMFLSQAIKNAAPYFILKESFRKKILLLDLAILFGIGLFGLHVFNIYKFF